MKPGTNYAKGEYIAYGAALDAARAEGRREGLEEASKVARLWGQSAYRPEQPEPGYASCEANIRALIDAPTDPVAEAARVLANLMKERCWSFYPIEMPITKDGKGPATFGEDAVSVVYEVWEADTFRSISEHEHLPDAIEAALRAIAQKGNT